MPVPSNRNKILPARGNYADLNSNVASLLDGEICYAIDQDQYYQKEGTVLVSVGATKAQGLLADSALQSGDDVSELLNDAGYLTNATLEIANATDVNLDTPVKDQLLVYDGTEWVNSTAPVIVEVHNQSGATINKGTPVYVSGTHTSGKPLIAPADNDGTSTYPAIGLLHEDLDNGDEGHAMVAGMLFGVDTSTPGWSAGDALYLSSNAGVLTNSRPTVTAQKVQKVGLVTRVHATAGSILVIGAGRINDIPNDLVTLTGVALGDSTLGSFTGTTISDNESIKDALQSLETAVESVSVPSNVLTSTTQFSGHVTGTYNNTVVETVDNQLINDAGNWHTFVNDGGGNIGQRWNATQYSSGNSLVEDGQAWELQIQNDTDDGNFHVKYGSTTSGTAGESITWATAVTIDGADGSVNIVQGGLQNDGNDVLDTTSNLADLSNVNSTAPTDGQVLTWDNANSYWAPADAADGITNLSYTASTRTISSSTGTDAVLTEVVASGNSGLMTGADKSKLDGIETGATADQTAAEILTAIKTVDGTGSGLDADTLDGIESASFLRSDANDVFDCNGNAIDFDFDTSNRNSIRFTKNSTVVWEFYHDNSGDDFNLRRLSGSGEAKISGNRILTTADEGSGNGLDADTLDGVDSGSFVRSDADDTISSNIVFSSTTVPIQTRSILFENTENDGNYYTDQSGVLAFDENFYNDTEYGTGTYDPDTVFTGGNGGGLLIKNQDGWGAIYTTQNTRWASANWDNLTIDTNQVWHAGNDGASSGLDADTLDGIDSGSFLRSDVADTISQSTQATTTLTVENSGGAGTGTGTGAKIAEFVGNNQSILIQNISGGDYGIYNTNQNNGIEIYDGLGGTKILYSGSTVVEFDSDNNYGDFKGTPTVNTNAIWHAGNDGSSSGLDADTLDGQEGSYYLDYNNFTNTPTISSGTFDGLTGKTSGTGEYSTSGTLTAGRGDGGVSLTVNDGYGNANVTFNHKDGTPEQNGTAGRIEVNTDSTGSMLMVFEGKSSVTSGTAVSLTQLFRMSETEATCLGNTVWHAGNDGSGSGLDADTIDGIQASSFIRGDNVNNGATEIRVDDADFIVSDNTDGTTNYIWRDHSASKLYLGSGTAVPTTRSDLYTMGGNQYWHAGNDGSGSGLDADTVDGLTSGSFIRTDANDNVSAHTEWQDNYEIRLGNDADFRMEFNGTNTIFRNYKHADGDILFQGENSAGSNQNILRLDTSGTRTYCILYENGGERLRTVNGGIDISGTLSGMSDVTLTGELNLMGSTNAAKYIDARTGDGNALHIRLTSGGDTNHETAARFYRGGGVDLYHHNSIKFQTTSAGAQVIGTFSATTKFFDINHPTKEGMRLRHGSLEGPESGVYVRGRLQGTNTIELPDYWIGLVHEDTITVNLTPIGSNSTLHKVTDISNNTVTIAAEDENINCFYMVFAERKDVEKVEVEYIPQ